MKLFIKELYIWPADEKLAPRTIYFSTDKVNIVTGWSATGKSSIIAIVNYVLGADSCNIPVGIIRDKSSWYGLLIDTDAGLIRVARRKPSGRSVDDVYWLQQGADAELPLPSHISGTTTADLFRVTMNGLSGLSNVRLDPDSSSGFSERASFRDMSSFNFLPQHIVANPNTLFEKADSSKHREKLRNILPLALGIITNEDLLNRNKLKDLREELKALESELRIKQNGTEAWRTGAIGAFYRAQDLQLLPPGEPPADLKEVIGILQNVVESGGITIPNSDRNLVSVQRLEEIRKREQELDIQISGARRKLRSLKSLRSSVSDYADILADQRARVQGVGWFKTAIAADHCVLCGSESDISKQAIEELEEPIKELEELTVGTTSTSPMVDNEMLQVERQLSTNESKLLELRKLRAEFEVAADRERGTRKTLESVYRFIGNTEQALRILGDIEDDGGLKDRIKELQKQIGILSGRLDERRRKEREVSVRERISRYIVKFVEQMGVKGAVGEPVLDERELNLKFLHEDGAKPDFLWEIGSGENWMAYHLATLLALHGVFLARKRSNCVPTFLIIDQPSQVYFPSDTFEDVIDGKVDLKEKSKSRRGRRHLDDLESTKQIFRTLVRGQQAFKNQLQIIVLDHADRRAWGEDLEEAGNWRNDEDFLIPLAWGE
jgi:hypothetical protein